MNFEQLLAKYQALLLENTDLKRQIEVLKAASITADSKQQDVVGALLRSSSDVLILCRRNPLVR